LPLRCKYIDLFQQIKIIKEKMEAIYKINIRSTLNVMQPGDVFEFSRKYRSATIRTTASRLKEEEGKFYSITTKNQEKIVVTRIS
jgi:hypothetical protein